MRRRIIYIIIAVVVIVIAVVVAYWFFFSQQSAPAQSGSSGTLPEAGLQTSSPGAGGASGGIASYPTGGGTTSSAVSFGVISDEPVLDYFVDAQNNVTVVEPDGKIASVVNSQATFLSSTQIQGLIRAAFSFDGKKILVNFGDPSNPQTSVFDLATKAWTPLAVGIVSPAWSPTDYRIAYLKTDPGGTQTLTTVDAAKASSRPAALLTLHTQDLSLVWPNKDQMVLSDKPSALETGSAWLFTPTKGTLTEPIPPQNGFEAIWSATTSSAALVFGSGAAARGGTLLLWNPVTDALRGLAFLTLPPKCAFHYEVPPAAASTAATSTSTASSTPAATNYLALYCGVPQNTNKFNISTLPDAYLQMGLFTSDSFYKVNTENGSLHVLFSPPQSMDAINLKIINSTLFFVNRYDQKLYALSLGA